MRPFALLAILAGTLAAAMPADAQTGRRDTNVRTETQERLQNGIDTTDALNWLGIIGLLGLLGLRRGHDEDSYHPADLE